MPQLVDSALGLSEHPLTWIVCCQVSCLSACWSPGLFSRPCFALSPTDTTLKNQPRRNMGSWNGPVPVLGGLPSRLVLSSGSSPKSRSVGWLFTLAQHDNRFANPILTATHVPIRIIPIYFLFRLLPTPVAHSLGSFFLRIRSL